MDYHVIKNCYSKCYNKTQHCKTCDANDYCANAKCPNQLRSDKLWRYIEGDELNIIERDNSQCDNIPEKMTQLLCSISKLISITYNNERYMRIVKCCLENPNQTLRELAVKTGYSFVQVNYTIKKILEHCPELQPLIQTQESGYFKK